MRVVIDLQGAQSSASRKRGIGRYTLALAEAMVRNAAAHEVWIALNGAFSDTIKPIRTLFGALMPEDRIVVWETPCPVAGIDSANTWRRQTGEILRESFLASLDPDLVHVSSLFEGLDDDAVTSAGVFTDARTTAITLYDLIPLANHEHYLTRPAADLWYQRKLGHLRRAGLLLAISESSRHEAIDWLDIPEESTVNISAAADARFRPVRLDNERVRELQERYGLKRPFVMYTGGIDYRKNLAGLIGAFAKLPIDVRRHHQLAVVCSALDEEILELRKVAKIKGLGGDELAVTGYVPDEDLVALYNSCAAFCFPSRHEGFGLPALEAMQCGAAVIGSNVSSIPEVIGRQDALFDPNDEKEIASRLTQVLTDANYRHNLSEHGLRRARQFTWAESARRAWSAMETLSSKTSTRSARSISFSPGKRLRLAYVSPLPPERSGIADYSAQLLPELARHYDVDVVVDQSDISDTWIKANCLIRDIGWFDRNAHVYDRIVYQFGNSTFHRHMFDLLDRHPGVVVLHDFYLSGIIKYMESEDGRSGLFSRTLYQSHGYHAVAEQCHAQDVFDIVWKYPANLAVLQTASGIIIHSEYSRMLAQTTYGKKAAESWARVPLLRSITQPINHNAARKSLGIGADDFLLCSFGSLAETKLNHRLLQAWASSSLQADAKCHVVFVGEMDKGHYADGLRRAFQSRRHRGRVHVTGFAAPELYRAYLSAADVAVQLRSRSRGETSGAVLDCMAYGLPTIVNAHGSLAELPQDCVLMLPDEFDNAQLVAALETLRRDSGRRKAQGERARSFVRQHHRPRLIADQYHAVIEEFFERHPEALKQKTLRAVANADPTHSNEQQWLALARVASRNLPGLQSQPQLLVDVTELILQDQSAATHRLTLGALKELIEYPPAGFRVEPIYAQPGEQGYHYARRFTLRLLNCPTELLNDAPIEMTSGDVFFGLMALLNAAQDAIRHPAQNTVGSTQPGLERGLFRERLEHLLATRSGRMI